MMFNLRGLVFDDPHGTEAVKLPTLRFEVTGNHSQGDNNSELGSENNNGSNGEARIF